jgi:hypothetical protein
MGTERSTRFFPWSAVVLGLLALGASAGVGCGDFDVSTSSARRDGGSSEDDPAIAAAVQLVEQGRATFRFDTFGDESFWGGALQLHLWIAGHKKGGVGEGLSARAALALGLKFDLDALPPKLLERMRTDTPDFDDPQLLLDLLQENAVIGLAGKFRGDGTLRSVGVQCSLCHSTVDDALMPGVGRRRDGWPNRDLDIGSVMASAPNLAPIAALLERDEDEVRDLLKSWGPGKFDAQVFFDGKTRRPDGKPAAVLIPPLFGLAGVSLSTWTGWGSVGHWTAMFANLELHGQGTFFDPRLDDPDKFPLAAKRGYSSVRNAPDIVSPKLAALHVYQLVLRAPSPPEGSFDAAAARRGQEVFEDKAQCATCHVPPLFTEPGWPMHTAQEIGVDDFQSTRSPDDRFRTAPLRGLFTREKGGYYHDGRFASLYDVVDHYDRHFGLELGAEERKDLVEYLKSL